MYSIKELSGKFVKYLDGFTFAEKSLSLFDPIDYILSLKAKRIRPIMCLAAYNIYANDVEKAFDAAMSIELFHNFSLIHDDLMDDADIRRGKASVHIKYDTNTAILSGDAMLILAYQFIENYDEDYKELMKLFNKTSLEVCLGQRMDMDFESMDIISIDDYLQMIALKTSVLIACSLKMGALLGGAGSKDAFHLYEFGKNLGIAFQIQDDLLDSFGNAENVGKKIGGDILQKKKTYLFLKSLELLSKEQAAELKSLYSDDIEIDDEQRILKVTDLFKKAHVNVHAQELKLVYQQLALSHLDALQVEKSKKQVLIKVANELLDRNS